MLKIIFIYFELYVQPVGGKNTLVIQSLLTSNTDFKTINSIIVIFYFSFLTLFSGFASVSASCFKLNGLSEK